MTPPHCIRLRGFWEVTPLNRTWVRYLRRFGRPRISNTDETVWIAGDAIPGAAEVSLNGVVLGRIASGQPFAFEITYRLNPRNILVIDVNTMGDAPLGEVRVEIRS